MRLNHNKIICIKLVHLLYLYIRCTVTLISKYHTLGLSCYKILKYVNYVNYNKTDSTYDILYDFNVHTKTPRQNVRQTHRFNTYIVITRKYFYIVISANHVN